MDELEENILDELARDLQTNPPCDPQPTQIHIKQPQDLSKQGDLERYINESTQKSNDIIHQVIKNFAVDVGDDPERAAALSTLVKSNTDLLKLLNDRLIKEKENTVKLEIQKLRHQGESMEKIIDAQKSVIMNRDEMFKELFKDSNDDDDDQNADTIDV